MDSEPIDIGHSHVIRFTCWRPDRDLNPQYANVPDIDPLGVIVEHPRPDGTPCVGSAATFDTPAARQIIPEHDLWQLVSLDPLTLTPSLLCGSCGDHGHITGGRWQPC